MATTRGPSELRASTDIGVLLLSWWLLCHLIRPVFIQVPVDLPRIGESLLVNDDSEPWDGWDSL